jgi:hypothetical protein
LLVAAAPHAAGMAIIRQLWPALPGGPIVESVDWMTIDADQILIGTVVGAARVGESSGLYTYLKVHVRVTDRLRADENHSATRPSPPAADDGRYLDVGAWRRNGDNAGGGLADVWWTPGASVLLFLDHRSRIGPAADPVPGCEYLVRRHGGWLAPDSCGDQAIRLDGTGGVATIDRRWLTRPEDIRRSVLSAMYTSGERLVINEATAPSERSLVVPANGATARQAAIWAISDDRRAMRRCGIRLLEACDSPTSRGTLRFLLQDQADDRGNPGIGQIRSFPIRRAARDALARLGEDVGEAIVEEPTDWYRPFGRSITGVSILALAGFVAIGLRPGCRGGDARPRWRLSFTGSVAVALAILAALSAAFWLRSLFGVDSVRRAADGRLCEITSFLGHVQVRLDPDWFGTNGLAAALFHPTDTMDVERWDPARLPAPLQWTWHGPFFATAADDGPPAKAPLVIPASPDGSDRIVAGDAAATPTVQPAGPRLFLVSYASVTVALGAFPVVLMLRAAGRHLRRRARRRAGLCAGCGYDLRASGDICPECGAVNPSVRNPEPSSR